MAGFSLQKRLLDQDILPDSALNKEIHLVKKNNERLLAEINTQYRTNEELLFYLEKIIGKTIDASTTVSQPFYSDFGRHITLGKDVFINKNVMFVDLGGITIEDHVLIGPDARLITVNHLTDPEKRRGLRVAPILVKRNAWIGANATILQGITIGENAIVAADSTVTRDVPANVIVAGSPAKEIRKIDQK
ncbi:DapH/DapD/GlmU-related protein [Enterococcus larvae]|uniref:DapH/DapD/GlmU-related protein n=1 Tax=Enterococcus larvae TaxID=2794352 RepID=UPI003F2CAA9E